ncbi:MAG: hypothetical protein QME52_07190 [Bacteroidota bacterium]|nr:hypothetical protein [Bacteroidota bacterium]
MSITSSDGKQNFSNTEAQIYLDQSNRIAVTFPYNEQTIRELKRIPGHKWHPDLKRWSFPNDKGTLENLIKVFDSKKIEVDSALLPKDRNSIAEEVIGELKKELKLRNLPREILIS